MCAQAAHCFQAAAIWKGHCAQLVLRTVNIAAVSHGVCLESTYRTAVASAPAGEALLTSDESAAATPGWSSPAPVNCHVATNVSDDNSLTCRVCELLVATHHQRWHQESSRRRLSTVVLLAAKALSVRSVAAAAVLGVRPMTRTCFLTSAREATALLSIRPLVLATTLHLRQEVCLRPIEQICAIKIRARWT
jgi:hypothetical protein